ncbi:SOS response-associated peptidase [Bosea rubneri]|uniref:Abasic site processing protein n=1 Tax=Bosea rubneri TaxID=3075434 RepID=A0ABU3S3R3_9HYPH|nr:SOS response-associated peptidase [Bosea sp. ZW T0_25]MDU0339418.1 SOS response-associated peptidase [Bosea sp. ZW T0_25]
MCGRYAVTLPPEAMRQAFAYREQPNFPPRYNIAPTQPVPVVRLEQGTRQFILMRWGFIPGWVKDPKDFPLVINIRSESAAEKPSFRAALARRRCLMPADGFYEWHRLGEGRRQENRPYLFRRPDRGFFAFAALWETWHSPDGSEIDTVAMVTGPANGQMAAIHHRSPVILAPEAYDAWLDPASEPAALRPLLRPPPDDFLEMIRLGDAVNKAANDGPELQQPFDPASAPKPPEQKPAMRSRRGGKDDAQGSLF